MSEQGRSSKTQAQRRRYTMRARARSVDDTRRRIVDAAVRLHGTVGPAATTISAIAQEASVTRATFYRHFPDEERLFAACSAAWEAEHPAPDTSAWAAVRQPRARVKRALTDTYDFFRHGQDMLRAVGRDQDVLPPAMQSALVAELRERVAVLEEGYAVSGDGSRALRAALAHALAFETWHSLCVTNGLSDAEAADAMTAFVSAAARSRRSS